MAQSVRGRTAWIAGWSVGQLVRVAGAVPNAADGQPKPASPGVNSETVAGPTGAVDEIDAGVGEVSWFGSITSVVRASGMLTTADGSTGTPPRGASTGSELIEMMLIGAVSGAESGGVSGDAAAITATPTAPSSAAATRPASNATDPVLPNRWPDGRVRP